MTQEQILKLKINFDPDKVKQRILENAEKAQKKLDSEVLTSSNSYVPVDTGVLQKSGIANTIIGSGTVAWETPYAKKQYYENLDHSKQRNPQATSKWFETAKAKYKEYWIKIVKGEF